MNLNKFYAAAAIFMTLIMADSCKDKEEEPVKPYLNGRVEFEADEYICPDIRLEFEAKGAIHPEGAGIGYSYRVTPGMDRPDTIKTEQQGDRPAKFTYRFGNDLKTYKVTVSAFAEGYYSISTSKNITVVKGGIGGSIAGNGIEEGDPTFTDSRDNRTYHYQTIGNLDWMRENLAYAEAGEAYGKYEVMNDVLGRYYNWTEAQSVCPEGWRLPSDEDFKAMAETLGFKQDPKAGKFDKITGVTGALMANTTFNGITMWEFWPENRITNKSKLAVMPCGYVASGKIDGIYHYAALWTDGSIVEKDGEYGTYRYIINVDRGERDLISGRADKSVFKANVRCVRDSSKIE